MQTDPYQDDRAGGGGGSLPECPRYITADSTCRIPIVAMATWRAGLVTEHLAQRAAHAREDVFSHHRALSTCHLAGIAGRLGRKIELDPATEAIIGDAMAQALVARPYRKGFEIEG